MENKRVKNDMSISDVFKNVENTLEMPLQHLVWSEIDMTFSDVSVFHRSRIGLNYNFLVGPCSIKSERGGRGAKQRYTIPLHCTDIHAIFLHVLFILANIIFRASVSSLNVPTKQHPIIGGSKHAQQNTCVLIKNDQNISYRCSSARIASGSTKRLSSPFFTVLVTSTPFCC